MGVRTGSTGFALPFNLPVSLSGGGNSGFTLPFTLPFTLSSGGETGFTLPFSLPITLSNGSVERKSIKLPIKETCVYANEPKSIKLQIKETANVKYVRMPVTERAWVFYGLVLEENIVQEMASQVVLMEDVKARILADYEMINGSDIKISWYGDKVDKVEVYVKMSLEDEYEKVGTYLWEQTSAVIKLGSGEFDVMLKGIGETGLSEVFTMGEPNFIELNIIPEIPENEKIFDIPINYVSEYRININY